MPNAPVGLRPPSVPPTPFLSDPDSLVVPMTPYLPALYCNNRGGKCLTHVGTEGSVSWAGVRSVVGLSSKRFSPPLAEPRSRQGPFAPLALPSFFTTMDPSDSRAGQFSVMSSQELLDANAPSPSTRTGLPG